MRRPVRHEPLPRPDIGDVLREIVGADADIPTGFGWVRLRCVFHDDRTPSASVNHDVGGYNCHSCGRHGDSLKLLQDELGLTFREACDKARELTGETAGPARKSRRRKASDLLGKAPS